MFVTNDMMPWWIVPEWGIPEHFYWDLQSSGFWDPSTNHPWPMCPESRPWTAYKQYNQNSYSYKLWFPWVSFGPTTPDLLYSPNPTCLSFMAGYENTWNKKSQTQFSGQIDQGHIVTHNIMSIRRDPQSQRWPDNQGDGQWQGLTAAFTVNILFRVENLSPATMGRGIDSRNRVWNWDAKLNIGWGAGTTSLYAYLVPRSIAGFKVTDTGWLHTVPCTYL